MTSNCFDHPQLASGLNDPNEAAHFGGAKRPVKERPLVPPLIDDRSMLKTITPRIYPPRPVVPYTTSTIL